MAEDTTEDVSGDTDEVSDNADGAISETSSDVNWVGELCGHRQSDSGGSAEESNEDGGGLHFD